MVMSTGTTKRHIGNIQVEGDNKIVCAHCTMCGESTRVCDTMSWNVAKQWAIRHVCVGREDIKKNEMDY